MKDCVYASTCSGCSYWGIPYAAQLNHKIDLLRYDWENIGLGPFPEVEALNVADRGLRDRLDFRWEDGRFGLFDRVREEVVDLQECLQLSPALSAWYQDFRQIQWPFEKASIRLRVSPEGLKGVWLDLPHEDVRELFEETQLLRGLLDQAIVEIGQRRKRLVFDETEKRLRLLKEPHLEKWTRTWINDEPQALFSRIADFSQPGDQINRVLVQAVSRHLKNENLILDWGCGAGNLSLPALPFGQKILSLDSDDSSLEAFRRTLDSGVPGGEKIQIRKVDFHQVGLFEDITRRENLKGEMTWIVDPPRSGAGALFFELPKSLRKIVSVSCYTESFLQDSFELHRQGFRCESLSLVDQFPQTHHAEWVSKWVRD